MSPEVVSLIGGALVAFSLYLTLAVTSNLQYGFTGIPNFGLVIYPMIASFAAASIATAIMELLSGNPVVLPPDTVTLTNVAMYSQSHPGETFLVAMLAVLLAALIAAAIGLLTALPAIRLKADYLGISLLAITESVRGIINNTNPLFGGVYGFRIPINPVTAYGFTGEKAYLVYAALSLAIAALALFLTYWITNSPYGRVLKMIRDDEELAKVFGKDVNAYKLQVMAIGGFLAGMMGGLYVFYLQYVNAFTFPTTLTFEALFIVIIGGMASLRGTVVMTALYVFLGYFILPYVQTNFSSSLHGIPVDYFRYIIFSVLLILVLIYRPKGIVPERAIETEGVKRSREEVKA
ncbi:MAG: branched-chain amino acid ABC transporter permease [Thermoprotei archaeon]